MHRRIIIVLPLLLLLHLEVRGEWELLDTRLDTIDDPNADPLKFGTKEVHFVDPANGILVRSDGRILVTRDSGTTWTSRFLPGADYSANRDISFPVRDIGYIAGMDGLWKSTDRGESWRNITPLTLEPAALGGEAAVCFSDPSNAPARAMTKRLIASGYSDVALLEGGLLQWQAQGGEVVASPAARANASESP